MSTTTFPHHPPSFSAEKPAQSSVSRVGRGGPVTDRLIRHLKVSDPPERFQRLAADSARAELKVETVAWLPASPREAVVISGEASGWRAESLRAEIAAFRGEGPSRIVTQSGEPGLSSYLVVAADEDAPAGWLVAANPIDGREFGPSDIEVLAPVASLIATQRSNARLYIDLKDLLFGVIRSLTAAIDAKDPYTSGHSERVARIAVRLGEELGMSLTQRGDLYLMGLLHDVGKIGIDDSVLKKAGRLTPSEFEQIQAHVRIGVNILADLKKLSHLLPGVAHHHEALDGSGYPSGLKGEAIPLPARILAVADSYDAMSSNRPYRRRMSTAQIEDELRKGSGVQWDPKIIDALFACQEDIEHIRQRGLGESLRRAVDDTLGRH